MKVTVQPAPFEKTHGLPLKSLHRLKLFKSCCDYLIHVIVLVSAESSAEDHVLLFLSKLPVLCEKSVILLVIHRIVRLHAYTPLRGVFPGNHGLLLCAELKVLVLDHTCVRDFPVRIVYNRIALVVLAVQNLCLKTHGTVLQRAQLVVEILVDHTCEDNLLRNVRILFPEFKEIHACPHICIGKHLLHNRCISPDRDSLISVIKIIVVINEPARQSLDNKCRELGAFSAPLLLRISFDQLLVNVAADKEESLFLQVLRLRDSGLAALFLNDILCLLRRENPPHLAECVHIKRKIVEFILVNRNR